MTNDEEKQALKEEGTEAQAVPATWTSVAVRGFWWGLIGGGGYLLQDLTTGGWSTFGYILAFGAFIALMYPLSWKKVLVGFPVWVASAVIVVGIAAFLSR